MKKIFSILAAALIAFSFASCKGGKNEPEQAKFTIEVSDITATSATVKVTPVDANAYYYFDILEPAAIAAGYNVDSFALYLKEEVEFADEKFPAYLSKGADEYAFSGLMPETDYVVVAFQLDSNYAAVGDWTKKEFKTTKLELKGTKEVTGEAELMDFTALMGLFAVYADVDANGAYLELTIASESLDGTFTEADFDDYYGAWLVVDEDNNEYYPVISANLKGVSNADATEYKLTGDVICGDGYKYNINVTCPIEDALAGYEAPARKIKVTKRS